MKADVIRVVNQDKKYKAKNGKEYTNVNYYLKLDSGRYIAIRPAFAGGYHDLELVSETVINGK